MWSKGAQKDYLDTYDEYDEYEEGDESEIQSKTESPEVEIKSDEIKSDEIKPVEIKPVEIKPVEIKPVEIKSVEIKPVEIKSDEQNILNYEYTSEEDDFYIIKSPNNNNKLNNYEMYNDEIMFDNFENYSYNKSFNLYRKYKEGNSVQNIIKRFGFKKLKSNYNNIYYLDKTMYFIWKYNRNSKTGEDELVRVDDEKWDYLKTTNINTIIYDRYLPQPVVCY